MAMLAGTPSVARISALTLAAVYERPKADLAPILEGRPQVARKLSHASAERQAAGAS
jgi:hypothetical protein